MTLLQLRAAHPALFYEQTWFAGEAFMQRESSQMVAMPTEAVPEEPTTVVSAVDLALAFIGNPDSELWRRFLWTNDHDDKGQRIYVGGVWQSKKPGFQIHRHLEINYTWGWPVWR